MQKILDAIQKGQPISLKTTTLPYSIETLLDDILDKILTKYQKSNLHNAMSLCLKEITGNAKKANLKRAFFRKHGLDINNAEDYESGMEQFKADVSDNIDLYNKLLEEMKFYIQITYQYSSEGVVITVSNNVPVNKAELKRIRDRYDKAIEYSDAEQAFYDAVDQTEGAGLGIIMTILMLKKVGINPKNFIINSREGLTVARLAVHFKKIDEQKMSELTDTIYNEIDVLPLFPESIERLQDLIKDEKSEINEIAAVIKQDPSFAADLLKLSNSAQFMLPRRVSSIDEAVKIVGFTGLEHMLVTYGTKKIFDERFGEMGELWEHLYRCAFYAQELAKNRRFPKPVVEDAFLGGLLHDIGKFLITAVRPDLIEKIFSVSADKHLDIELIEDLAFGITHAKVGAILAEKWNFPETLIKAIEYHHEPIFADEENMEVVYTVYLANAFCNIETGQLTVGELHPSVLQFFNLNTPDDIKQVSERLSKLYEQKKEKFRDS